MMMKINTQDKEMRIIFNTIMWRVKLENEYEIIVSIYGHRNVDT